MACARSTILIWCVLGGQAIPVEVCITSNVMTGCCTALEQHPIRKLFDAGVLVTLNTTIRHVPHDIAEGVSSRAGSVWIYGPGTSPASQKFLSRLIPPKEKKRALLARL